LNAHKHPNHQLCEKARRANGRARTHQIRDRPGYFRQMSPESTGEGRLGRSAENTGGSATFRRNSCFPVSKAPRPIHGADESAIQSLPSPASMNQIYGIHAHNRLVAGSSPAGPTTQSRVSRLSCGLRKSPRISATFARAGVALSTKHKHGSGEVVSIGHIGFNLHVEGDRTGEGRRQGGRAPSRVRQLSE
jgi:hypothetical protein